MPITIDDHLKRKSNKSLLIVLGETALDEKDCSEKLLYYGSIKEISLSPDKRAAFVDFECAHAPLLVARCFLTHRSQVPVSVFETKAGKKTYVDLQFPTGMKALLPGCSIEHFLYLQHVPHALSTSALREYFSTEFRGVGVKVHRPGSIKSPSSRLVIEFDGADAASFHCNAMNLCEIKTSDGKGYKFYAIPHIPQLSDCSRVMDGNGCAECNVQDYKPLVAYEEAELAKREAAERQRALDEAQIEQQMEQEQSCTEQIEGESALDLLFPSISDEAEQRRWGFIRDEHGSSEKARETIQEEPKADEREEIGQESVQPGEMCESLQTKENAEIREEIGHESVHPREVCESLQGRDEGETEGVEEKEDEEETEPMPPFADPDTCNGANDNNTPWTIDYDLTADDSPLMEEEEEENAKVGKEEKAYDFAAGDAPFMGEKEEVYDAEEEFSEGREDEDMGDPNDDSAVPLEHAVTVAAHDGSDEDTIDYDTVSDDSSEMGAVGGGYGEFVVHPDEWDEQDQIRYGYARLSTIEEASQEDAVSQVDSNQEDVFLSADEEEEIDRGEDRNGKEEEEEEDVEVDKEEEIDRRGDGDGKDDEEEEDVTEEEQRETLGSLVMRKEGEEEEAKDVDVEEREQRELLHYPSSAGSLDGRTRKTSEREEEKEEVEQRESLVSSTPISSLETGPIEEKRMVEHREGFLPSPTPTVQFVRRLSEIDDSDVEEEAGMDGEKIIAAASPTEQSRKIVVIESDEEEVWKDEGEQKDAPLHSVSFKDRTSAGRDEKVEVELRDGPRPSLSATIAFVRRLSNVVDSEEEEAGLDEEGREEKEEAEQRVTARSAEQSRKIIVIESDEEVKEEDEEEEEGEEKEKEGEQRDEVPSLNSTLSLLEIESDVDGEDEEEEEVKEEKELLEAEEEIAKEEEEQRELLSSASVRRWSRMSMVDQEEEDYRSSEYLEWLTRVDGTRDSLGSSSGTEAEIVPLPSSLPVSTWGRGITVVEKATVDPTVQNDLLPACSTHLSM